MMIHHTIRGIRSEHISSARPDSEIGERMGTQMVVGSTTYVRQPGEKLDSFIRRATAKASSQGMTEGDVVVRLANGWSGTLAEFLGSSRIDDDGQLKANPPSKSFRVKPRINIHVRGYHGSLEGWLATQPD